MKKLILMLVVAFVAFQVNAAAPTYAAVNSNYTFDYNGDDSPSTAVAFDTVTSATDSSALATNFVPKRGYEYILVRDAITGTGSDSVALIVRVDALDGSGNLLYSTAVDSMTAAAGEAIALPFGGTLFGNKFNIVLKAYAGAGTQAIINRAYMFRRKALTNTKDYR